MTLDMWTKPRCSCGSPRQVESQACRARFGSKRNRVAVSLHVRGNLRLRWRMGSVRNRVAAVVLHVRLRLRLRLHLIRVRNSVKGSSRQVESPVLLAPEMCAKPCPCFVSYVRWSLLHLWHWRCARHHVPAVTLAMERVSGSVVTGDTCRAVCLLCFFTTE